MKVQISIDDVLLSEIDSFAEKNYQTRSGFISMACSEYIRTMKAMDGVKEITDILKKNENTLSDENRKILQSVITLIDK